MSLQTERRRSILALDIVICKLFNFTQLVTRARARSFIYESCNLKIEGVPVPRERGTASASINKNSICRFPENRHRACVLVVPGWWRPTHNPDRLKFRRATYFRSFNIAVWRETRDIYIYIYMQIYFSLFVAASENSTRRNLRRFQFPFRFPPRSVFPREEGKYPSFWNEEMYLNRRISLSTLLYLSHCRSFSGFLRFLWPCPPRRGRAKGRKNLLYKR